MALDPKVKKVWQDLQKQHDKPVNAIGMPISPNDENTMRVWRDEGIDAFMKK